MEKVRAEDLAAAFKNQRGQIEDQWVDLLAERVAFSLAGVDPRFDVVAFMRLVR